MRGPARRVIGQRVSASDIASAPIAGAARSRPRPQGPTCSMSLANIGSSAVAPPSSTANRSSEIAPSTTGLPRTKLHAGQQRVPGGALARRRAGVIHAQQQDGRDGEQQRAGGVDGGGAGDVDQAADRRPGDDRHLHARRAEGQRTRQRLPRAPAAASAPAAPASGRPWRCPARRPMPAAGRAAARRPRVPAPARAPPRPARQHRLPPRVRGDGGRPRRPSPARAPARAGTAAGRRGRGPRPSRSGRTSASRPRPSTSGWHRYWPVAPTRSAGSRAAGAGQPESRGRPQPPPPARRAESVDRRNGKHGAARRGRRLCRPALCQPARTSMRRGCA